MSWGEIKKALNSTIGTPSFKPLDRIIREAISEGVKFQEIEITKNGVYYPGLEHDGFSKVVVNVAIPTYSKYDGTVDISGLISFTYLSGNYGETPFTFQAEEGMTWGEFITSDYNRSNGHRFFYSEDDKCIIFGPSWDDYEMFVTVDGSTPVELTDTIIDGNQYEYCP